jgi:hypothetical protein
MEGEGESNTNVVLTTLLNKIYTKNIMSISCFLFA